jgi:[ribosomal protein S18]-alanine N-acetyltransferase
MSLTLRYMQLPDIPQVVTIDNLAFDPPWSARSYSYEVSESNYSHMVVLEQGEAPKPAAGWRRIVQNLSGATSPEKRIVGYGGLWHIMDEAHISTIATHPEFRRRGLGEVLLAGMIRRALTLKSDYLVLEVRVSNTNAQNLYAKYDFKTVGVKRRYYHNNGEDAYEMHLYFDAPDFRTKFEARFTALLAQHQFIDEYTECTPPRKQR